LSVTAAGTGISYQWYASPDYYESTDDIAITAATSNVFTKIYTDISDSAYYYVKVTGTCGTLTSNMIAISGSRIIHRRWEDGLYIENPGGYFTRYQWYYKGSALSNGTFQYYACPSQGCPAGKYVAHGYYTNGNYESHCIVIN
jgi:hypothetical protein